MKAFTLLETVYVLLILSIIFSAIFWGYSFRKEFFYLKNFLKKLRFALETTIDMSQRAYLKDNYLFCSYGIYFASSTYYETLGFYTTSTNCDSVILNDEKFLNSIKSGLSNKFYITYYQELTEQYNPQTILSENFKGQIKISLSNDCSSPLNFPVLLVSLYSTSEFYVFLSSGGGDWQKINTQNIYLCLNYRNDEKILRINKLGQIILEK
jgi:type II secretory pathway pseudopilin PulG